MLKPITPSRSSLTPVPSVISPFFLDETVAGGSWESSWREGRQRRLFWEWGHEPSTAKMFSDARFRSYAP